MQYFIINKQFCRQTHETCTCFFEGVQNSVLYDNYWNEKRRLSQFARIKAITARGTAVNYVAEV